MFIEHEGALYQGPARDLPQEVWSRRQMRFVPYQGETPKGVQWGREISREEAERIMRAR